MMEVTQEELEGRLMSLLLHGGHPALATLREQYAAARVTSRKFSGFGFFTRFAVSNSAPLIEPPNFAGGDVDIQLENVLHGAGCVVFVRDGRLSMLECYTHADPWPERIVIKSLAPVVPPIGE